MSEEEQNIIREFAQYLNAWITYETDENGALLSEATNQDSLENAAEVFIGGAR